MSDTKTQANQNTSSDPFSAELEFVLETLHEIVAPYEAGFTEFDVLPRDVVDEYLNILSERREISIPNDPKIREALLTPYSLAKYNILFEEALSFKLRLKEELERVFNTENYMVTFCKDLHLRVTLTDFDDISARAKSVDIGGKLTENNTIKFYLCSGTEPSWPIDDLNAFKTFLENTKNYTQPATSTQNSEKTTLVIRGVTIEIS